MSDSASYQQQAVIVNERGLHARAAAKFVSTLAGFDAEVHVSCDGERVNANSIMELLMLACHMGRTILIEAKGPDAEQAMATLIALVEDGFGENDSAT